MARAILTVARAGHDGHDNNIATSETDSRAECLGKRFTEVVRYGFEFILQLNGDLNPERTPCLRQAARRNRDEKPSNLNLT